MTSIEYALIAGFISIFIIGAVDTLGSDVNSLFFDKVVTALTGP